MTGAGALVGEQMSRGLEIWAAQHNADVESTGLPKVEVEIVDSQASSTVAVQAYQRLRSKTETPLLFSTYTNVAAAVAPFVERDEVTVLQAGQGTRTPDLGPSFIQITPSFAAQSNAVMDAALKEGVKKIAVIGPADDVAFEDEANRLTDEICPDLGCEVTGYIPEATDGSDGGIAAIKATETGADAIFSMGVPTQIEPVLQQLNTDDWDGYRLGFTDFGNVLAGGKADLLENSIYSAFYYDTEDDVTKAFIDEHKKQYDSEPLTYTFAAYKAGQLMDGVLTHMVDEEMSWDGPSILEASQEVTVPSISGDLKVDADRRLTEPIAVYGQSDGKNKLIELFQVED